MADTFEEAIRSLSAEDAETRPVCIIDNDLRTITTPSNFILGVYNDKDVHEILFSMPRYYNDIDLSVYSIRVNYINAAGTENDYYVETKDVLDDTIKFSWLTSRMVFSYAGEVRFIVCLRNTDEEGVITNEFNTTIASGIVLEGIEVDDHQEDPEISDLIVKITKAKDDAEAAAEQSEENVTHYPRIEAGKWIVYDAKNDAWVDTGIAAQGPKGDTGETGAKGDTGKTPDFHIGAVYNVPYGQSATASITGTPERPILSLAIPEGARGAKGDTGARGPKGDTGAIGTPLVASTASEMTDTTRLYIYTGSESGYSNGHWYHYDGTAWVDGGLYNAVAFQTDKSLSVEGMAADSAATGEAIDDLQANLEEHYAKQDGVYPDLAAGIITTDKHTSDSTPYLFRSTGGPKDVGNREYVDAVVGGTVVWNQKVSFVANSDTIYGITRTNVSSKNVKAIRYTGTSENTTNYTASGSLTDFDANHVYFATLGNVDLPSGCRINFSSVDKKTNFIGKFGSSITFGVVITSGITVDFVVYPQAIDLTQMFGTTIADYIYSLEQSTAGAGIAKLREWGFDFDTYHEYNPGSLGSVEGVSAHEAVGFNQWDEEWEVGGIDDATGENYVISNRIRSKNHTPVVPNATYKFTTGASSSYGLWVYYYDADKNFVSPRRVSQNSNTSTTIRTIPKNAAYIRFELFSEYGTTYNHDICINLSDPSRNGEYEPYEKHTYPLDSTLTLRGIPKLVDGELQYDGDRYLPDGTVERRYGVVDLGTLNWNHYVSSDRQMFRAVVSDLLPEPSSAVIIPAISEKYRSVSRNTTWIDNDISYWSQNEISIIDNDYTDSAIFKAAMQGVLLVYELAAPTTETADPYISYQVCDSDGTEEYVTTGNVPVGHETRYPLDLVRKIEDLYGIPTAPTTAGTYTLKAVVTSSGVEYQWVSE